MEKTENVIFTNMCMVYDGNGNVLVEDRVDPDWRGVTFPGGHVECGESFYDAMVREIFEETGLTVSDLHLCGIKDWMRDDGARYVVFCYKTCKFGGELLSSDEGNVFWTTFEALPRLNLAESLTSMLSIFMDDSVSELFYEKNGEAWAEILKGLKKA